MWKPRPISPVAPTVNKAMRGARSLAPSGPEGDVGRCRGPSAAKRRTDEHRPVLERAAIMFEGAVGGDAEAEDRGARAERLRRRDGSARPGTAPGALQQPAEPPRSAKRRADREQWPVRRLGRATREQGLSHPGVLSSGFALRRKHEPAPASAAAPNAARPNCDLCSPIQSSALLSTASSSKRPCAP